MHFLFPLRVAPNEKGSKFSMSALEVYRFPLNIESKNDDGDLGPVLQNIISLTSSLMTNCD